MQASGSRSVALHRHHTRSRSSATKQWTRLYRAPHSCHSSPCASGPGGAALSLDDCLTRLLSTRLGGMASVHGSRERSANGVVVGVEWPSPNAPPSRNAPATIGRDGTRTASAC